MSNNKNHSNYTLADINDYLQGRLSPAEMHAMERAALQDPFLADALEGLHAVDSGTAERDLADIHAKLAQANIPAKLVHTTNRNNWIRIAAAIILLVGAGAIGWYVLKQDSGKKELAQQTSPVVKHSDSPAKQPEIRQVVPVQPPNAATKETRTARKPERIEAETKALAEIAEANSQRNAASQSVVVMEARRKPEAQKEFSPPPPYPSVDTERAMLQGRVAGITSSIGKLSVNARDLAAPKTIRPLEQMHQFSGTIRDSNANPIANASILADQKVFASDEKGRFTFSAPDTLQRIQVGALGFKSTQAELKTKQAGNIVLNPDNSELSEVVVTGYGTQKKKDITGSVTLTNPQVSGDIVPIVGWAIFYVYLDSSMQNKEHVVPETTALPKKAIDIELSLNSLGKPLDLVVLSGFAKRSHNKILVNALKKGPVWRNTDGSIAIGKKKLTLYFTD